MGEAGSRELTVASSDAPDDEQGRREIVAQLLVWRVLHPEEPGVVLD